jgi:hypothetical protein
MATGQPSVPNIRSADVREINNALNAIRQQLITLNGAVNQIGLKAGQNALNANSSGGALALLQQQVAQLTEAVAVLAAGSLAPLATYRADAAISVNDPVFSTSDGGVSPVDTQDPTAIFAVVGIATTNASLNGNITVRRAGQLSVTGAGFEAGRAVYAQSGSGLTQTPNYDTVAIPVGVATASETMDVRGAWPTLLELPMYAGGYEQYMPVALSLVENTLAFVESIFGQPDGIVVKVGDQLITREIVTPSGSGLNVYDGDGVFGNPTIS